MSSETTTEFPVGARVLVSADADDVWFGGEVEGVVIEDDEPIQDSYVGENRVLVRAQAEAWGGMLTQYVRPEDLTLITNEEGESE